MACAEAQAAEFSRPLGPKWLGPFAVPWEQSAARPAGEQLMLEERLVVPPLKEERVAPPQQRRVYIRREDVHKHGATEGCPGCRCILEDKRATLPQTEACRARITEAMEKDEAGQARLEAHAKKRKERRQLDTVKPKVVADKDTDITAEDAAGEPEKKEGAKSSGSGSPPPAAAESEKTYPDDWKRNQWQKPR